MIRPRLAPKFLVPAKWIGTVTGVAGALLVAANIGMVGWGFVLWAISSALWAVAGWALCEPSLVVLQAVFLLIDLIGIWRWMFSG